MTNIEKYRQFCEKEKNIPIFSKAWWLDSVCGANNWDVVLVEKGGQIFASLPYLKREKMGFTMINMPLLTQTMGVYIKYPDGQKYYKKLSWEKDMMAQLIDGLPKFDSFSQNFHYSVSNWLPFYWNGFKQTTRYTYLIKNIELSELEKKFETDIRRRRRKAVSAGVKILESEDLAKFYELNQMTFQRQKVAMSYDLGFVENLFNVCKAHNSVKMFFAHHNDKVIAANFLVYDENTVYYLMGGIDPSVRDLGGMDLILYESIKFAIENNKVFDFEGSMIESIEKYFRSFGAVQTPYFNITKTNSKILKIRKFIRDLI